MDESQVDSILQRLAERADREGIEGLNDDEQTVLLPCTALGLIENGGLKYFFERFHDLENVATCLRRLGFWDAASACEEFLSAVFPNGAEPPDELLRKRMLSAVDWKRFDEFENRIAKVSGDSLTEATAKYIDEHRAAFVT